MPLFNACLTFINVERWNKWHFWNPEIKLDNIGILLKENYRISKSASSLPEIALTLVQTWKWMSPPPKMTSKMTRKICVTGLMFCIFIRSGDLTLILTCAWYEHLYGTFVIPPVAFWQFWLATVSCLASATDKVSFSFDLWYEFGPPFHLGKF